MKKLIPGFEFYFAGDDGFIYSDKYLNMKRLSLVNHKNGYTYVQLSLNGKKLLKRVHRLIALAFLGKSELQVNHIDGNKSNNNLSNLEYVSSFDNMKHAHKLNLYNFKGENHNQSTLTNDIVKALRSEFDSGSRIIDISKKYNIKYGHVEKVVKRRIWKHV